jgi:hypothetical protein
MKISLMKNHWKHLAVAGLVASALFCGAGAWQPAPAEASDYYIGTYSDGGNAFLVTESVYIRSYRPFAFSCTVKYGYHHSLYYWFYPNEDGPYYENSEGYHGYVFDGDSPVAENIYRFVRNNW